MDWDWEEGPPRDVPRRRPEEPPQDSATDGSSTFSGAIEHFERPPADPPPEVPGAGADDVRPEYFDDDRTQIIRRPAQGFDGGPQDVEPVGAADRPAAGVVDGPPGGTAESAPEPGSFTEALNYFQAAGPVRPEPRPDLERPRLRTIEAAQRGVAADAADRRYDDQMPRPRMDRAARRAQRRRQVRRRRLVALAVLVIIVVLLVLLVVKGCGGPSEGQAAAVTSPAPVALRTSSAAGPLRMAAGESVAVLAVAAADWHLPAFKEAQ